MHNRTRSTSVGLLLAATPLLVPTAAAQEASALLREGDASPDGVVGSTVSGISAVDANHSGGYACTLSSSGGVSQVWGSYTGGPGALLRAESTIGNFEQTAFETFFGLGGAEVAYSPTCNDLVGGSTGLDSVWLDGTVVAIEEAPYITAPDFWRFGSRPGVTQDGQPYFAGGITSVQGGTTENRGLWFGDPLQKLYLGGDLVPGTPAPLTTASAVDFDFRFSAFGTHHITPVDVDTTSNDDAVIVMDNAGLVLGGTLVQESLLIPVSVGGLGDNWDNFDYMGVTEAGEYAFTGDTDGDAATDEFLLRNGVIEFREGDVVDGWTLTGSLSGMSMNELGQVAYIWNVDDNGSTVEAIFRESTLLVKEGDEVDWDGDGSVDATFAITDITGINGISLADDGAVYFMADVQTPGGVLEGFFKIDGNVGTNYCQPFPNSTGGPAIISATGSNAVAANSLTLHCTQMPPNEFGYFLVSFSQAYTVFPGGSQGALCLGGVIGRYNLFVASSGPGGMLSLPLDLTQVPMPGNPPNDTIAVAVGDTLSFQCWFRDLNPGQTSNFSDGIEITFE